MTRQVRLGEAIDIIRGVSFDKSEVRQNADSGYLPILRAGNIQDRLMVQHDLVWVPFARVSATQRMKVGDIAIAISSGSSALVGKTAILEADWDGSVGAFCAILRAKGDVSPRYLAQWFRGPAFQAWREKKTRGANIQNLQISDLATLELPLPPLDVQERLADATQQQVETARNALIANEQQRELAALLVPATLSQHFQGCTPIAASPKLPEAPHEWKWYALEKLARLESGHTPSRRRPEWWGGDVPWLALPDIRKLHGKIAHETTENTNATGLANSSARLLPVGTVCVSRTASVGYVSLLGRPMATSQDFCNWICDPEKLDPDFLMYAFMASQKSLQELGSGAVHKSIYMPTIKSFHICAPDIDEQRRIARTLRERLATAESLNEALKARLTDIKCLPQRLLAAAFGQT